MNISMTGSIISTDTFAKKQSFIIQFFMSVILLATVFSSISCQKQNAGTVSDDTLSIVATINGTAAKSVADQVYAPLTGSKLHLFYDEVGNTNSKEKTAFTYSSPEGVWSSDPIIFWDDLALVGGRYRFFAVAPEVPIASPSVSTSQEDIADYTVSDQLIAYRDNAEEAKQLPLTFKHVLSQIKVTLNVAAEDGLDITGATLSIGGVRPSYTIDYSSATDVIPAIATVTGSVIGAITPYETGGSFYAIVPSQIFAPNALVLTIIIKEKEYTWTNPTAITSVAGMNINISLDMQKTAVIISPEGITLTDWGTSLSTSATVNVDGLSDEASETGGITPLPNDELFITHFGGTQETTYTYKTDSWSSVPPMYWDNLPKGTSTFKALYTPDLVAPTDYEKDYYIGSDTDVAFGAPINFAMTHAMSQISITLKSDVDALLASINSREINIKHLGSITVDGATPKSTIGNAVFTEGTLYNVTPQTLNSETTIQLETTKGHVYTVKLSDLKVNNSPLAAFVAGKSYAITLDVAATEIELSVKLQPWVNVTTDKKVIEIDNLIDGTLLGNDVSIKTGDELKLWRDGGSSTAGQFATYTYTTGGVPAWSSLGQIYWGNLPAPYNFSALLTPKTTVAPNEVDYLIGSANAVNLGSPINLTMTHAMSQITVELIAGEGYDASDFLNKLSGREINLEGLSSIADDGGITLDNAVGNITTPVAFTNKTTYVVAPQLLTSVGGVDKTIKLEIENNNHFYTVKLSDLTVSNIKLTKLEAGKSYNVKLTINEKEVVISTTLTPWVDITVDSKTVEIDGLSSASPDAGNIDLKNGDKLYLQSGTQKSTYTFGTSWSSIAPIYWGNMPTGSSTFDALFTPITVAANDNEIDYLVGSANSVGFGAPINLKMTHGMSQITVNLIPGVGFNGTLDKLSGSVINLKPLNKIELDNNGDVVVTLDPIKNIMTTTKFLLNTPYVIAPQTLESGSNIVLTLAQGHTYTVKFSDLVASGSNITELKAGEHYVITLTLNDSGVSLGLELAPWNTVNISNSIKIDNIANGSGSGSYVPKPNDVLKLWLNGLSNQVNYTYKSNIWDASPNKPMYWGDLPKAASYTFKSFYTPIFSKTDNEKDYLIGTSAALGLGAAINLSMTHAMSKIKIILVPGTGYTGATLSELTGRVFNLKGLKSISDLGVITLDASNSAINFSTDEYIIAPQSLNTTNTIVLTRDTGHTYTLKLNSLFSKIEAGKSYVVTVTVNDTEASIGVSLKDWDVVTGGGEAS